MKGRGESVGSHGQTLKPAPANWFIPVLDFALQEQSVMKRTRLSSKRVPSYELLMTGH
jgi:hypothetical protein